jgi:hypothetical protein
MFVYTVEADGNKQIFEGFRRPTIRSGNQVLGLVFVFGEFSLWELDPDNIKLAIEELERYYRCEYGESVDIIMYRRTI